MIKYYGLPQKDGNDSVCVITPTGRIKELGIVAKGSSNSASAGEHMLEVARFLKKLKKCNDNYEKSKQLIDDVIQEVINHNFEVWLTADYYMYKAYPETRVSGCYTMKIMIEKFVATIELIKFSKYFQTEWNKLQPVTYYFGSTEFVIGENLNSPIDILIDLLDELDDRRLKLENGDTLPDHHMAQIRSVLGEWSPVLLTLNELIRMSEVEDRLCSGCEFVRKLVDRVGLENLPPKTKELYAKVFLTN